MEIRPISSNLQSNLAANDVGVSSKPVAVATSVAAPVQTSVTAVQQPGAVPSMGELSEAVKNINKTLQTKSQNIEFAVDQDSERMVVKVVDRTSGEVLRQIPSEEALEISKALDHALQGLLIKQQA
ncbi:flagellar protein FlaG [Noviherbaspirillum aerium]|uniref:flagellar protein FlaG n=1 Tax=Noviherbaspirillum aerium TaxID=2588497 RepID=UPI00178C1CFF|nr:flagellar protein FlaG [Noviherbaspirillum aerium]